MTKEVSTEIPADGMSPAPEAYQATQPVLMSEVRYGIVFAEINEVFNSWMHRLTTWVTVFAATLTTGGTATLLAKSADALQGREALLYTTVVLAVLSAAAFATRQAFEFKDRARQFKDAKVKFQDLEARGWGMAQGTLDKELKKLRAGAPAGGAWLANAAYNKACGELGYPQYSLPVPRRAKFVASFVG